MATITRMTSNIFESDESRNIRECTALIIKLMADEVNKIRDESLETIKAKSNELDEKAKKILLLQMEIDEAKKAKIKNLNEVEINAEKHLREKELKRIRNYRYRMKHPQKQKSQKYNPEQYQKNKEKYAQNQIKYKRAHKEKYALKTKIGYYQKHIDEIDRMLKDEITITNADSIKLIEKKTKYLEQLELARNQLNNLSEE